MSSMKQLRENRHTFPSASWGTSETEVTGIVLDTMVVSNKSCSSLHHIDNARDLPDTHVPERSFINNQIDDVMLRDNKESISET